MMYAHQLAKIRKDIESNIVDNLVHNLNTLAHNQLGEGAPPVERPKPIENLQPPPPHNIIGEENKVATVPEVDAMLAHREYLDGKLPNVFAEKSSGKDACDLKNNAHGRLLSRVKLRISGSQLF